MERLLQNTDVILKNSSNDERNPKTKEIKMGGKAGINRVYDQFEETVISFRREGDGTYTKDNGNMYHKGKWKNGKPVK